MAKIKHSLLYACVWVHVHMLL